jgi:hypothetical protein
VTFATLAWAGAIACASERLGISGPAQQCRGCVFDAGAVASSDAAARTLAPGAFVWLTQFGSTGTDELHATGSDVAADVFVAGVTYGALPGHEALGMGDAVVAKLAGPSGALLWQLQFGTEFEDRANALTVDASGDVIVAGSTEGTMAETAAGHVDAFVAKLSGDDGEVLWLVQFGSERYDAITALATSNSERSCAAKG